VCFDCLNKRKIYLTLKIIQALVDGMILYYFIHISLSKIFFVSHCTRLYIYIYIYIHIYRVYIHSRRLVLQVIRIDILQYDSTRVKY
jgi:hypothetical protein